MQVLTSASVSQLSSYFFLELNGERRRLEIHCLLCKQKEMVETCFFFRAKTEQCQRELTSVACLASNDQLLPDFIPRFPKEIILNLFDNVSNNIGRLSLIN